MASNDCNIMKTPATSLQTFQVAKLLEIGFQMAAFGRLQQICLGKRCQQSLTGLNGTIPARASGFSSTNTQINTDVLVGIVPKHR